MHHLSLFVAADDSGDAEDGNDEYF